MKIFKIMISRDNVIGQAVDQCMKELYSHAVPKTTWGEFVEQNKQYSKIYKEWERFNSIYHNRDKNPDAWEKAKIEHPNWVEKRWNECIGPRPYEFYFLPKKILDDIAQNYVYAYQLDAQDNLLSIINILKKYCQEPIVNKYIDDWTDELGNYHPGYRSYDNPDNLEKEIEKILLETTTLVTGNSNDISKELQNKFFEFLDMAGNFFNWNRDLNSFNMTVYLGPSPNSNKKTVIENWKKYRNKDIEINEELIKKEYYGDNE